ncbi:DnaJ domain-containing protein [bacterium]|nr:DnaJ domain-containing protein [bacterium]MCI0612932.1 DnaJ domain-containing protein [bacterium]
MVPAEGAAGGLIGMDLYQVLKVPSNAKQVEIDKAYQKILKEAQFDPTIQIKHVELAYRILSDATQRSVYDIKAGYAKRDKKTGKMVSPSKKGKSKSASSAERRVKIESNFAVGLFLVMVAYMVFRFGFMLKSFENGDILFFRDDNRYFGTLVRGESSHAFGPMKADAYLIKLPSKDERWYPQSDVKSLCYRRED